jgi:hypothetical protein
MELCYTNVIVCEYALLIEPHAVCHFEMLELGEGGTLNYAETLLHMIQRYQFKVSEFIHPYVEQT